MRIIPSRLVPVVQDYALFDGLQLWAEPDLLAAQAAIRSEGLLQTPGRYIRPMLEFEPLMVGQKILEELPKWMSGI